MLVYDINNNIRDEYFYYWNFRIGLVWGDIIGCYVICLVMGRLGLEVMYREVNERGIE